MSWNSALPSEVITESPKPQILSHKKGMARPSSEEYDRRQLLTVCIFQGDKLKIEASHMRIVSS